VTKTPRLPSTYMEESSAKLQETNESSWIQCGNLWQKMGEPQSALNCFEKALQINPTSTTTIKHLAHLYNTLGQYNKAIEYFQKLPTPEKNDNDILCALSHCYFMTGDLPKAFAGYQEALANMGQPKDPGLWYDIGVLYELSGALDHARESFCRLLNWMSPVMSPSPEKRNEALFRLGVIYKEQAKLELAIRCFNSILNQPPKTLTQGDIWFHIGGVHELEGDFALALDAYQKVLETDQTYPKALQQLGWLKHRQSKEESEQRLARLDLMRSIELDSADAQTWYLLGRCYVAEKKYRKAYDAYQQAIYRDHQNPAFLCSIGVLYFQINQYKDALYAYMNAVRVNPSLPEVWYNLGVLYHSSGNQSDALAAFMKATELDPSNVQFQQKLVQVKEAMG